MLFYLCCHSIISALLGLEPAVTNGTFGSLYHLLLPEVVEKLPAGMHLCI